ncbi:type IV secretion system protein VirB8 [Luteibacter sp. Sphag1AF]|uniref:virB8 family protein n=1 Tax=Luteibacter sp. Sphag1AF TaxID=2587031 RepID=UPI0016175911|nr:type IV secretion system protein [Luteibacter sp. Sphag1AF]MBB3227099.1 type IV secretion system protein VirB8 [Luteibacter sp. Sphag1AF]
MRNKKSSPNIDAAISKSVNFELTVADLARRSEKRAWMVAGASVIMSLILVGGYFYMLPLKEKVPYIVMADAYTGTSSVSRVTDDVVNRRISASEAINRSNITHFVLARESYDVAMINLRDWATVLTMSSPNVAAAYTNLHSSTNPNSPYKTYGRTQAIRVRILSIVLIGGGDGTAPKGATVRFQRSLYNKTTGMTTPMDSKIATMAFSYKPNLKMDDQYRVENPLGFQVSDYRVDNDYGTAPPEEVAPARDSSAAAGLDPDAMDAPGTGAPDAQAQTGVPASPIPNDSGYPAAAQGQAPAAPTYPAAAPAPTAAPGAQAPTAPATAPRGAANGGRR